MNLIATEGTRRTRVSQDRVVVVKGAGRGRGHSPDGGASGGTGGASIDVGSMMEGIGIARGATTARAASSPVAGTSGRDACVCSTRPAGGGSRRERGRVAVVLPSWLNARVSDLGRGHRRERMVTWAAFGTRGGGLGASRRAGRGDAGAGSSHLVHRPRPGGVVVVAAARGAAGEGRNDYWRGNKGGGGGRGGGGRGGRGGRGGQAGTEQRSAPSRMPKANKEGMKRIQQSRSNNSTLASLEDLQSILDFADRNVGTFNCVNFSTAVHRLGKLNKPFKRGGGGNRGGDGTARDRGGRVAAVVPVNKDPRFHHLLEAIEAELVLHLESDDPPKLEDGRGRFGPREVSSTLWGLANCGVTLKDLAEHPTAPKILPLIAKQLTRIRPEEYACQNISNAVWAIATMHQHGDEYLPREALNCVEAAITERLGADDFIPQGVSNCLWAFGSLNRNRGYEIGKDTVDAFGEGILRHIRGFKSMELSNLVWATSTLKIQFEDREVMAAMDAAMIDAAHDEPHFFSSQSISNILWAAGNHPDGVQLSEELLGVLADLSVRKFETFTPQGLSNSAWGFASVGFNPGGDFIDLLKRAWCREGQTYIVTEVANLLWSFYILKEHPGDQTLESVSRRLADIPEEDMHLQTIANILYTLAQMEYLPPRRTMERLEDICTRAMRRGAEGDEEVRMAQGGATLSNLLWAMSSLRYRPGEEFFAAFNEQCVRRCDEFTDQGVSNIMFAYANLDSNPGRPVLDAFVAAAKRAMPEFTAQGVANSAWAWAVLDHWPDSELIDLYKEKIKSLDRQQISKLDYVQLFQASYAFEQFSPHGALMEGELLATSREVWEQISSARVTISALHQDVSGALTRMGIPHEIEYLTQDNLFSMDIALRGRKVAIEVDGPSHFCANKMSERLGSDRLRERFLAHKGWNVLRVPWYEWNELGFKEDERVAYLESLLWRIGGLTVDEAKIVPGGVKLSHRVDGEFRKDPYTGVVSDGDDADRANPPRPKRGMTAYDIDKSGRLVRNSPRAGAGKGRYVLGDHDGSRGDPRDPKSVAADLFEADRNDPGFAVNRYDPRDVSKNGRRQPRAQQGVATTDDDGSLGGMDGYRERAMRAEGKRVIVRRDGSLTVTTDLFDPALGERTDRQSPGRARRSDARPYGMDGASMGTQERLDRARRAREGPDDDDDEADENGSNSNSIDPRGIVQPLPARPAPRARARARLAPLSSASKRAAAAATTGRRVVRSKSSLPPGESASPPRSGDDGTVAKKGEPLSGLKGMGPGSVAALAEIGVYTVDDLAAMSDDAVDEAKRNRPRLKLSHLRKVARAAVEPDR